MGQLSAARLTPALSANTHILSLLGVDDFAPSDVLDVQLKDSPDKEVQEERCGRKEKVTLGRKSGGYSSLSLGVQGSDCLLARSSLALTRDADGNHVRITPEVEKT